MRRRLGAVLAAGCIAAGAALARVPAPAPTAAGTALHWPLRAGDVVLRQGDGIWSELFARANPRDRRFSHAGVVVRADGAWQVVHAQADDLGRDGRVRRDDWAAFVAGARGVALLRADAPGAGARVAAAALALHADRAPFDFDFSLADARALYCTELVWLALNAGLGREVLPVKPHRHGRPVVLVENLLLDVPELRAVRLLGPPGRPARGWRRVGAWLGAGAE